MNWLWIWRFLALWNRKGEPRYFSIHFYADYENPTFGYTYDAVKDKQ